MTAVIALIAALGGEPARATDGAVPVLHDGAPDPLDRVAAWTMIPRDQLQSLRLADLLEGMPPRLVGEGRAWPCTGSPTSIAEFAALARAVYDRFATPGGDLAEVRTLSERAEAVLGCLSEPVDPAMAARHYLIVGAAAYRNSDLGRARDAFRQARAFSPSLPWPPDLVDRDGRPIFDQVLREERQSFRVRLDVIPATLAGWIDGQPVTEPARGVVVRPGRHLVQVRDGDGPLLSVWTVIERGEGAAFLVPEAVPPDALAWVADEQKRDDLGRVLAVLGESIEVYVLPDQGGVWRGYTGEDRWTAIDVPDRLQPLARAGRWLIFGGVITAGSGLATLGITCAIGAEDAGPGDPPCGAEDPVLFPLFTAGEVLLYSGAGMTVAGLLVNARTGRGPRLRVEPLPGGFAVRIGAPALNGVRSVWK